MPLSRHDPYREMVSLREETNRLLDQSILHARDEAEAVFEHGVLTLTLPKAVEAQTRTIPVTAKPSPAVCAEQ